MSGRPDQGSFGGCGARGRIGGRAAAFGLTRAVAQRQDASPRRHLLPRRRPGSQLPDRPGTRRRGLPARRPGSAFDHPRHRQWEHSSRCVPPWATSGWDDPCPSLTRSQAHPLWPGCLCGLSARFRGRRVVGTAASGNCRALLAACCSRARQGQLRQNTLTVLVTAGGSGPGRRAVADVPRMSIRVKDHRQPRGQRDHHHDGDDYDGQRRSCHRRHFLSGRPHPDRRAHEPRPEQLVCSSLELIPPLRFLWGQRQKACGCRASGLGYRGLKERVASWIACR
jgi:hypothetical protein